MRHFFQRAQPFDILLQVLAPGAWSCSGDRVRSFNQHRFDGLLVGFVMMRFDRIHHFRVNPVPAAEIRADQGMGAFGVGTSPADTDAADGAACADAAGEISGLPVAST